MSRIPRRAHAASVYGIALLVAGGLSAGRLASAQTGAAARRDASEAKKAGAPRLSAGRPDLQGVWNFSTATPLERPPQYAGKTVLTDEEAKVFLKNLPSGGCRFVKCDGSDASRLESAYDDGWYDAGSTLA